MRLTLRDWLKLVIACALALAYLDPIVRLANAGVVSWMVVWGVAAVATPLIFALVVILLFRRHPGRGRLVRVLLLTPIALVLAASVQPLALRVWRFAKFGILPDLPTLGALVGALGAALLLGMASVRLVRPRIAAGADPESHRIDAAPREGPVPQPADRVPLEGSRL